MDTSIKGHYSSGTNSGNADPRDIQTSPDFEQELRAAGRIVYDGHTGQTTIGHDHIAVEAPTGNNEVGVLSTLKTKTGSPITDMSAVEPTSLVTVGGQTMSVNVAMKIGVLARTASGEYYSPAEGVPGSAEAQQFEKSERVAKHEAENTAYEVNFKSDHCSNQIAQMKARAPGVDGMITKVFDSVVNDADSSVAVGNLASAIGADANSVGQVMNDVIQNTLEGIHSYAKQKFGVNIPVDDFVDNIFERWSPQRIKSALLAGYYNSIKDIDNHIEYYLMNNSDSNRSYRKKK